MTTRSGGAACGSSRACRSRSTTRRSSRGYCRVACRSSIYSSVAGSTEGRASSSLARPVPASRCWPPSSRRPRRRRVVLHATPRRRCKLCQPRPRSARRGESAMEYRWARCVGRAGAAGAMAWSLAGWCEGGGAVPGSTPASPASPASVASVAPAPRVAATPHIPSIRQLDEQLQPIDDTRPEGAVKPQITVPFGKPYGVSPATVSARHPGPAASGGPIRDDAARCEAQVTAAARAACQSKARRPPS